MPWQLFTISKITAANALSGGNIEKYGAVLMVAGHISDTQDTSIDIASEAAKKFELQTRIKHEHGVMDMQGVDQGFIISA